MGDAVVCSVGVVAVGSVGVVGEEMVVGSLGGIVGSGTDGPAAVADSLSALSVSKRRRILLDAVRPG